MNRHVTKDRTDVASDVAGDDPLPDTFVFRKRMPYLWCFRQPETELKRYAGAAQRKKGHHLVGIPKSDHKGDRE